MALASLPPIWQPWTKDHLRKLTSREIQALFLQLTYKLHDVENHYLEDLDLQKWYEEHKHEIDQEALVREMRKNMREYQEQQQRAREQQQNKHS
jgi:hypothetical protein